MKNPTLRLGCHLSSADGCAAAAETALSIGANTFQTFTRNPRGGAVKPVEEMEFDKYLSAYGREVAPILFHAPYTLNFAAARTEVVRFARETLHDDLLRLERCPGQL